MTSQQVWWCWRLLDAVHWQVWQWSRIHDHLNLSYGYLQFIGSQPSSPNSLLQASFHWLHHSLENSTSLWSSLQFETHCMWVSDRQCPTSGCLTMSSSSLVATLNVFPLSEIISTRKPLLAVKRLKHHMKDCVVKCGTTSKWITLTMQQV